MNRRRWLFASYLAAIGCAHAPPTPTKPPPLEEVIASTHHDLTEALQKKEWSDLAVGVVIDDKLVYAEGFGVRDPALGDPVTPHTLFRLASLTKLFTGMAILRLRDAGKLDLDDPVSKYLPEINGVVYPTGEHPPILIRYLVTHTSGLPRDGRRTDGMSEADLLAGLKNLNLAFTPGSDEQYSNLGMALAGLVVARASGITYREYMRRFVLDPLGMSESTWDPSTAAQPVAVGMVWDNQKEGFRPIAKGFNAGAMEPAGGLYSNLTDMAKFAAFEMSAWPPRTADEVPPLSRASLRESQLTAGPVLPGGALPGVNWFVRDNVAFGQQNAHTGKLEGYRSEIALLPRRRVGVIVLGCEAPNADAIDVVTKRLLMAFAPLREEPPKPVGADLRAAVDRLIAWLQTGDRKSAAAVFSPSMLEHPPLFADTAKARDHYGGGCKLDRYLMGGVEQARVQVSCDRETWTFAVMIQPDPPHLIEGWWW